MTKEIQKILLEALKAFHSHCIENQITYYIVGGTVLGAVRHKGFIPWDDDIDVAVPREDYEKLLGTIIENDRYEIIDGRQRSVHYNLFAKFVDKTTTLVENGKIIEGVYIDIFPLDGCGDTVNIATAHFNKGMFYRTLLDNKQRDDKTNQTFMHWVYQKYAHLHKVNHLIRSANKHANKYSFYTSKYIGNINGSYGKKEIVERSLFGQQTEYIFEGIVVYGPEKYHEYLKHIYGDYLKLPPIEKQVSHHSFSYINLDMPYREYKSE